MGRHPFLLPGCDTIPAEHLWLQHVRRQPDEDSEQAAQAGLAGRARSVPELLLLFIEGLYLQPSQPHRVTSGLFTKSNLTEVEYNTKHAHFTNVKHINIT